MDQQVKAGTPFRRALIFHGLMAALATKFNGLVLTQAIQALGPYEGRGKGRGKPGKNYFTSNSKYAPHQGVAERAHRVRQIERGMLCIG